MRAKTVKGRDATGRSHIIASIRKGAPMYPNKDGVMVVGKDLDHFRVDFKESPLFDKDYALDCWNRLYGENPSILPDVYFQTDNPLIPLDSGYQKFKKSGKGTPICLQRCDGETCSYRWNGGTEAPNRTPVDCFGYPDCGCAFFYRLTFWLPVFSRVSLIYGEFTLVAHSGEDYRNIQPMLDKVGETKLLKKTSFTLYRQDRIVTQPNGTPVKKSIVHLGLSSSGTQQLALAALEDVPMLPAENITTPITVTREIVLQPVISVKQDNTVVSYRFRDGNGVIYWTHDSALLEAIVEDISVLKVDSVFKLDFSPVALVENDRIIELKRW